MRRLWNIRIGAAARENGISYSKFIHGLKLSSIDIDRKMLSELAILDSKVFSQLVIKAKEQLPAAS
jgi:large subunit ribosomal protein L20